MALITGVVFGLAPALKTSRIDLNAILKQGGRSGIGARAIGRNILAGGELALATMLLIAAGLLIQSLLHLENVPLGFRSEGVVTFQISPPAARYPDVTKAWALERALIEQLELIPGARGAAMSSGLPTATTRPVSPKLTGITLKRRASSPRIWLMTCG